MGDTMIAFVLSMFFLLVQSFYDVKSRNVKNWFSWIFFYIGLILAVWYSFSSVLFFVEWLVGVVVVGLFFWKIKKWFPAQFGSGDFWMILSIQSLNPSPIASSFIIFSISAIIAFVYSLKYAKEVPFAPFLAMGYLIFVPLWFVVSNTLFF
jgi:prepilin signal peptidase PulO-like enzyme (type II secretory pathway)